MNPLRPLAIWIGGRAWLPGYAKHIVAFDMMLRRGSRGRGGLPALGSLPGMLLAVAGRRGGSERTKPLLCVPFDGGWYVVGSNWGAPKPPVWALNLASAERARVTYRRREHEVVPRRLEGEERAAAWQVCVRTWPNYDKYALRTDRELALFELRPVG